MPHPNDMHEQDKTAYQAELLANRLTKRYKHLKKWAKRTGVLCFRLYDRDIPEIPLAVDIYEEEPYPDGSGIRPIAQVASGTDFAAKTSVATGTSFAAETSVATGTSFAAGSVRNVFARVALYERPYEKLEAEEAAWLDAMTAAVSRTLGIPPERIITKVRRRQSGDSQYEKAEGKTISFITREQGLRFKVNLSDYIDTGLFFDHRPLRLKVQEEAAGKRILNLYCYTGAFSVYAAAGDALHVDSVDLSARYLGWAEENMRLNGFTDKKKYRYIAGDVTTFLEKAAADGTSDGTVQFHDTRNNLYDIIVLDPPTFSNSKKTDTMLDINRDWARLVGLCAKLLSKTGVLYFSTNSRKLAFNEQRLPDGFCAEDISSSTIPEDFRNEKIHRVWKISRKATPRSVLVHGYFPEHP